MIETATQKTGRVGVVVPHGVLFRGGSEGTIRKAFIEENLLDAVIGLPTNLFFGTGIPAAILVFRRDRGERTDILFIDASREFENGKNQNLMRENVEVAKIAETYRARRSIDKVCLRCQARRDQGERLQPQHPAVCRHLCGRGRSGHCGGAGTDSGDRAGISDGQRRNGGVPEGVGAVRERELSVWRQHGQYSCAEEG